MIDGADRAETELEDRLSPSEEDTQFGEGPSSAASGYAPQGDQTQRFLTALGRFQRQIDRAQAGRPQGDWGEECMRQLVDALEIAIAQGWKDVVRTLTETARVLQSCSAAGETPRCVSFLADAYEILCMMVGDLIVGNVRSGVTEKWRARYARAVADLESAGIPLWADEEELAGAGAGGSASEPEPEPEPAGDVASEPEAESESESGPEPVEPWSARPAAPTPEWAKADDLEPFPLDLEEEAYATGDGSEEAPDRPEWDVAEDAPEEGSDAALEAFDPAAVRGTGALTTDDFLDVALEAEASGEAEEEIPAAADDWEAMLPGVTAGPAAEEAGDADDVACAETSDEAEGEAFARAGAAETEALDDADAGEDGDEDEEPEAVDDAIEEAVRPVLPRAVEHALDQFSERVERLTGEAPEALETAWAGLGEILRSLTEFAQEHGRDGALAPCMAMGRMVRLGAARRVVPDRRFTDLAFWFSGVYAEAGKRVSTPEIQDWLTECDDLLLSWATDAPVSAERAASVEQTAAALETAAGAEEREANPLWALFKTAQDAVAGGDPANAKTLALQAAAQIAEMQAKEAEAKVAETERRLTEGTAECDQMRLAVREAEQAVAAAEEAAEQGRRALETTEKRIAEAQDELAGLDATIDEIEEQIRALQARREEALEGKRRAGELLEGAKTRAVEEAEVIALREGAEREARAALEDARQRVTSLERRRVENETAMERARDLLNRRRSALQEIEETIAQIRDADGDANDGGSGDQRNDLLF